MLFNLEDYQTDLIVGCMDVGADNFNEKANSACNNCCEYVGCMDKEANNYNVMANLSCLDCCRYTLKPLLQEATTNTIDPITTECCLKLNASRTEDDVKYYTEWYMLPDVEGIDRCVRSNIWNYNVEVVGGGGVGVGTVTVGVGTVAVGVGTVAVGVGTTTSSGSVALTASTSSFGTWTPP